MLPRSDFGVFPEPVGYREFRIARLNRIYETTVSTVQTAPGPAAWLPGAQEHEKRTRHVAQSPPPRPQTPDARLTDYARRGAQAEVRSRNAHPAGPRFLPRAAGRPAAGSRVFDCQLAQTARGFRLTARGGHERKNWQCRCAKSGTPAFPRGVPPASTRLFRTY